MLHDVLNDVVHHDALLGDASEDLRGHSRLVGHAHEHNTGQVSLERHTANNDIFHSLGLSHDHGPFCIGK